MSIHMKWPEHDRVIDVDEWIEKVEAAVAGGAVALALSDLDEFARVNDELGREVGDKVLDVWIRTLAGSLPDDAIIGRIGGDEFVIAFPNASAENALILLEEVRTHLAAHPVEGWTVGATFGIAARPPHADEVAELFQRANEALARGKREGGGRVAIWVEEKMVLKSNYYSRASLDRLSKLAGNLDRTEASLLREALDDLFKKLR
ncbi:MAG: GGDEF domain-containing protein [Actinomycetota bacterium]